MKQFRHYFVIGLGFSSLGMNAAVLTVDNNPATGAQYTTMNAAISAASNYDTLLVQPSPSSYGALDLTKPLTIIGSGHDNSGGTATVCAWLFTYSASAGSRIEGIRFENDLNIQSSDIVISNCRAGWIQLSGSANNVLVIGCVFLRSTGGVLQINSSSLTGVLFANNYIGSNAWGACCPQTIQGGGSGVIFEHNIIVRYGDANGSYFLGTAGSTFTNNVLLVQNAAHFNPSGCVGCTFNNNLVYAYAGGVPAALGGSNLDNVAPTWAFGIGSPLFDYANDYHMLSGAPLTGATDGGEVGVHGGTVSFNNPGYPRSVPRVTAATVVDPIVPQGGSVQVNFSATQGQP